MYNNTITLFNFHKSTGKWYPSVISDVDLVGYEASAATKESVNNSDEVDVIIHKGPCYHNLRWGKKLHGNKGLRTL